MSKKSLPDASQLAELPEQGKMSWLSDLTGKAENLLVNFDERAASVLQNRNQETTVMYADTPAWPQRLSRQPLHKKPTSDSRSLCSPPRPRRLSPPVKQPQRYEKKEPPKQLRKTTRRGNEVQNYRVFPEDRRKITADEVIVSPEYGYRRKSLPNNKELEDVIHRCQKADTLELENQMLKNEVGVCNQEISGLLDKLRVLEDDLKEMDAKHENLEKVLDKTKMEKDTIVAEFNKLKEKPPAELDSGPEYSNLLSAYRGLEHDFANINERNMEYQTQIKELEMSKQSTSSIQMKLENDLRFAHMAMNDLRADLEKSRLECQRIQGDWDAYKVRVKSMLLSKDKEILALQQDPDFSEGTKMLTDQIESLREEREQLSCALNSAREECAESARRAEQVEARAHSAEGLIAALREALREERQARNKAENQCIMNNKALKKLQMETTHEIAALQTTIRDRDNQLSRYKNSQQRSEMSVCPVADASALNVAECDRTYETLSNEKIQLLTQALVAKQGRIDVLVAENNTLKLQMENIEFKHRQQLLGLQANKGIVTLSDGDAYLKAKLDNTKYTARSAMSRVSLRIGGMLRRHPVFRLFVILYMAVLHLWVMMILLNTQGCADEVEEAS